MPFNARLRRDKLDFDREENNRADVGLLPQDAGAGGTTLNWADFLAQLDLRGRAAHPFDCSCGRGPKPSQLGKVKLS